MTIDHQSFSLERHIAAPPSRVFACWSDPELKRRWFVESDGPEWRTERYDLDFRIGGTESGSFVRESGDFAGRHENMTHFLDIVPASASPSPTRWPWTAASTPPRSPR